MLSSSWHMVSFQRGDTIETTKWIRHGLQNARESSPSLRGKEDNTGKTKAYRLF
nr:MAG TPA: hypothetical protein [Caudoviricetes sp.]